MEKRMGILRRIAACVLTLLVASPALYASGFENTGVGTRAKAMGGAFRAVADDWTAAYYNPAGYAFMYDNQVGGSVGFLHLRDAITPSYRYAGVFESGVYNDREMYNKHEILSNPSAGIVLRLPTWNEMTVGFSIYQPFDNNTEWTLFTPLPSYNDSIGSLFPINQYYNNLDIVAFQLTFAKSFREEQMAIGLGLQLLRADLNFNNVYLRNTPLGSPIGDRPRDHIVEFGKYDGNGWGFGLTAGFMYKATEKMTIGLTAALPFPITVDGEALNLYYMPFNNELDSATVGSDENTFVNGSIHSYHPTFESEIKLPASVGGGFAFQATEKLLVSLDASYTFWSTFEGLAFEYGELAVKGQDTSFADFYRQNQSHPTEFNGAGRLALGLAYDYNNSLTLLGGVSADQSANRDGIGFTPQFIDTGDKYGFNLGALLHLENWTVGFTTNYTHHPDLEITGLSDLNGDGNFDNFPGEYKAETYETTLSFEYRF
jgi:long-chain fatty acid transport protein